LYGRGGGDFDCSLNHNDSNHDTDEHNDDDADDGTVSCTTFSGDELEPTPPMALRVGKGHSLATAFVQDAPVLPPAAQEQQTIFYK
jgi:hypothetical protein